MNNTLILWCTVLLPWLSLLFVKKEFIKRFMSVAMVSTLTSLLIIEIGITLNWWEVKETIFPLRSAAYIFGCFPAATIWIFRFTYKKFWIYMLVDFLFNLGFAFLFLGVFMQWRNIMAFVGITPLLTALIATVHGALLYLYQNWQEGIFQHPYREKEK